MSNLPPSKEYVHGLSIGRLIDCKNTAQKIIEILDKLYEKKRVLGWETLIIKNEDMVDSNYILTNPTKVANNTYPYLFVVVQHGDIKCTEITDYLHRNEFIEIIE